MEKLQYFKAFIKCIFLLSFLFIMAVSCSQTKKNKAGTIDVGVARVDITPATPIRLAGFAARTKVEADTIQQRLSAKAIAFGSDEQNPSILIAVDLIGIQQRVTSELVDKLSKNLGVKPEQVVICATHSHGSPEIGNLINILQCRGDYPKDFSFSDSLLSSEELLHIAQFNELLSQRLESVAIEALKNRKPALLTWGKEAVTFAENRRMENGPVDHSLPVLFVSEPDGKLRAVLMNYACHGISLGPDVNAIHGDWMGEAQKEIEIRHPGVIAMVTIGYAGDSHPKLRDDMKYTKQYAQDIANSVDKLFQSKLQPITSPPIGQAKWIKLPFSQVPTVQELIEMTKDKTVKGYYARLALERVIRGESLPTELDYLVQTWSFGDEMLMINLGGEPVVDYSVRLKNELDENRIWLNGYANDVSCYIGSKRVIREGGYEADASMYWYNMPSPLSEEVEELIINTLHDMIPTSFKK